MYILFQWQCKYNVAQRTLIYDKEYYLQEMHISDWENIQK